MSTLQTVRNDVTQFIRLHKTTIYFIAGALLADHLFFAGRFRERLSNLMHKLLAKLEQKIDSVLPLESDGEKK